jgi:hypothetical protein
VAHGPVSDEANERWLVNLRRIAADVRQAGGYRSVDAITVRDDAPAEIRDRAAAELRALVSSRAADARVLLAVGAGDGENRAGPVSRGLRDRAADRERGMW